MSDQPKDRGGYTKTQLRGMLARSQARNKELKKLTRYDGECVERKLDKQAKLELEKRIRFIRQKPDYYYSITGFPIVRQWYLANGLTPNSANILIIVSYQTYFAGVDAEAWGLNRINTGILLKELEKNGLVMRVPVPGGRKKRKVFILTEKGRGLINTYKKLYDKKMVAIRKKIEEIERKQNVILF